MTIPNEDQARQMSQSLTELQDRETELREFEHDALVARKARNEAIVRAKEAGVSMYHIANLLSMSKTAVRSIVLSMNEKSKDSE